MLNFVRSIAIFLPVLLAAGTLHASSFSLVTEGCGRIYRAAARDNALVCRVEGKTAINFSKEIAGDFSTEVVLEEPISAQGGFSVRLAAVDKAGSDSDITVYFLRDGYGNGNIYIAAPNREGKKCYFDRQNNWSEKWSRTSLLWQAAQTLKVRIVQKSGKMTINVQSGKYALSTKELPVAENGKYRLVIGGGNGSNDGRGLFTVASVTVNQEKIDLGKSEVAVPEFREYNGLPFDGRFAFSGGDGYLQLPEDFDAAKKYPLLIFFHGRGGITGFSNFNTPDFVNFAKLSSDRGFIVAAPGYGTDSWLNEPAEKLTLAMLDHLQEKLPVEEGQVFAMGCSMGGASALLFTARHPERISAVCDIFGITDYTDFYSTGVRFRTSLTAAFGGTPQEKPEYYASRSAISYIDVLKTKPVMVIHGSKDSVVPQKHSDKLVEELRKAGGNVVYHIVKGADHDNKVIRGLESTVLNFFRKSALAEDRSKEPECFQVMASMPELSNERFHTVEKGGFFRNFPAADNVPWQVSVYDSNMELNQHSVYPSTFPFLRLNASATRGEYTFLTFAIQTRSQVKDFTFKISELTGDDGSKLAPERVKLFLADTKEFLMLPETGTVPADKFFSMALFMAAPQDCAGTVYRGTLSVAGAGHQVDMPINFSVLPFTLPEADIAFGAYLPGHPRDLGDAWGSKWGMPEYIASRTNSYFRFWKTRGLNSPTLYHLSPTVIGSGRDFKQDFSVIDHMADALKANGLCGPMVIDTRFYARWADGAAPRPEYKGISDVELFSMSMKQLKKHAEEKEWPAWLCTPEEEIGNGGDKVVYYEKYWKTLRQAVGQENEIVIDNDIGQGRKSAVDRGERDKFTRRQYNSWTEEGLAAAARDGAEVWSYNYGWRRTSFGLLQLRLNSHGHHQWADQWMLGGEWYVTSLTDDGVISSLKMERSHEGINDYRTAQWLRTVNPGIAATLIRELVSHIPIQRGEAYQFSSSTPDREFMISRWRMMLAGNPKLAAVAAAPGKALFGVSKVPAPVVRAGKRDLTMTAKYMPSLPVLDGKFEAAWSKVQMSSPFRRSSSYEANARAIAASDEHYQKLIVTSYTSFGAAYSQEGLLLKVQVNHSTPDQVADSGNDDGGLWKSDCVEFFFDIPGVGFYQIITNARGNRTLFRNGTVTPSKGIEIGTVSPINQTGGYAQEIFVPWTLLGLKRMPEAGTAWSINAGREYHTGKTLATWGQVEREFGERHNYGTLRFGADNESILQITQRPELLCGANQIKGKLNLAQVKNHRTLNLVDKDGKKHASVKVGANGSFTLDFFVQPENKARVFKLELEGMPSVSEEFIIQAAPALVSVPKQEYFVITGGEMVIPVSFLVSGKSRQDNSLIAIFRQKGREILRLKAPAVSGDNAILSFVMDGVAPGQYELSFVLADGVTSLPNEKPMKVNVLASPYVKR